MPPLPIKDLLKEPFGPYPDCDILDPAFKPQGTKLLQLERLRLQRDGQYIGLDSIERYLEPPTASQANPSPVYLFGVLVIQELAWLSSAGRIILTKELNKRDVKLSNPRSSQNSRKSTQLRELRLEPLYGQTPGFGEGFKIKVWLRCQKENAAMFMTAKDYPASLIINSRDQHRSYEILSIDRTIYDISRNFLERYRLVALIAEIMDAYKLDSNRPEVDDPPDLEVETFITAYLLQHKQKGLSYTTIFSSEDDAPAKPLLRHISRAEMRSIFAAHSAWLLAFYLRAPRKKCPIDIRSWCTFIHKVRVAKEASKSGNWGETYEDDEIWDPDTDESYASIAKTLAKFGGLATGWERRLINAITKASVTKSDSGSPEPRPHIARRSKRALNYDPDFSPESTPGCSDSEYDSDSVSPPFAAPRILLHMSQPPVLRPGRFIWDCPIPKCGRSIDLLKLTPQDLEAVKDVIFHVYVREKQYLNLRDVNVQRALCQMVSHHYCHDHLGLDSANLTPQKQKLFLSELSNKWHLRESPPSF
ncbi:hypothetical protein B0H17DRAFT_1028079 [Mycena rosella]|uniref:Uncharacterized protein n=1 Tax=Mycena rosella TaxID=1033263 RepID=A0AAD7H0H9_MYCRO|nr:hypothetical protein B0H17DRAFT_1028079 [Mycena rosella]